MISSITQPSWRPDVEAVLMSRDGLSAQGYKAIKIDKAWRPARVDSSQVAAAYTSPDFNAPVDADNSVSKIWGNIEVKGKVVAQITRLAWSRPTTNIRFPAKPCRPTIPPNARER